MVSTPVTKPSGDVLWYTVGDENIQYPLTWDETGGRWVTLDNTGNTKNGYQQVQVLVIFQIHFRNNT